MNPNYDLTLWKFAGYEPLVSIRWDQERVKNHQQAVSVHHDEQRKLLFLISCPFHSFVYPRQCWFETLFIWTIRNKIWGIVYQKLSSIRMETFLYWIVNGMMVYLISKLIVYSFYKKQFKLQFWCFKNVWSFKTQVMLTFAWMPVENGLSYHELSTFLTSYS